MARKKRKSRKSKAKRRKFISKISRDGKISKKEGQKAAKKGISLRKIRNRRIGDYRQASKDYERSGRPGGYKAPSGRPQYEPLKIKRGAEQADRRRSAPRSSSRPKSRPSSRPSSSPAPRSSAPGPAPQMAPQMPSQSSYEAPSFEMPDFQGMMDQQAAQYQSQLDSMRAEQVAAAEEYRRQAEEQRRQFELAQRTAIGNEARAGQQAAFKLGSDPGMKRGGTYGFRRRRPALMAGINSAGMLNV